MEQQVFTIKGVFKEAYAIIKPKLWIVVGQFTAMVVVFEALSYLLRDVQVLNLILSFVTMFVYAFFGLSYARRGSFSFSDLSRAFTLKRFCFFALAALLYCLAIIGGMLLLIIPGFIFMTALYMFKYVALEKEVSVIESLKMSLRITKGYRGKIFGFFLASILVILLGLICVVVGVLFAAPLVLIADALVYKKLSSRFSSETVTESPKEAEVVEVAVVETVAA